MPNAPDYGGARPEDLARALLRSTGYATNCCERKRRDGGRSTSTRWSAPALSGPKPVPPFPSSCRRWCSGPTAPALLAVSIATATGSVHAQSDALHSLGQRIQQNCGTSSDQFEECLSKAVSDTAIERTGQLATREGRSVFGEDFSLYSRMTLEPSGLTGDLDAVIPLSGPDPDALGAKAALFLQPGITTWEDGHGLRRNDIRLGMVWRRPIDETDAMGLSLFYQQNIERDHERVALGIDYAGRWGSAHLSHFEPITNWLPGRDGYEERARKGTELGARLAITSTLSTDAAMGRWEAETGYTRNARIGVDWQPHPWLSVGAGWESNYIGSGAPKDGPRLSVAFNIPLGNQGATSRPHWEGLGASVHAEDRPNLFAPITNVGRIATLERKKPVVTRVSALILPASEGDLESVSVSFLQGDAGTGSRIGVRVSVPEPLSADLQLAVHLAPGSGPNPAVPGQDFVDTPHAVTIEQGEISADVWIQLLHNADMQTARSLAVEVTLAD